MKKVQIFETVKEKEKNKYILEKINVELFNTLTQTDNFHKTSNKLMELALLIIPKGRLCVNNLQ